MKVFLSFFVFNFFLSFANIFAQTEPIAHLSVEQSSILEKGGTTKVTVSLKDASNNLKNATVNTNVVLKITGTAILGTDYNISNLTNSNNKTITINAGSSSAFLTITSVDDATIEPEENIIIEIESISSGSIHSINNDRTVKILDDDLLISLK